MMAFTTWKPKIIGMLKSVASMSTDPALMCGSVSEAEMDPEMARLPLTPQSTQ